MFQGNLTPEEKRKITHKFRTGLLDIAKNLRDILKNNKEKLYKLCKEFDLMNLKIHKHKFSK